MSREMGWRKAQPRTGRREFVNPEYGHWRPKPSAHIDWICGSRTIHGHENKSTMAPVNATRRAPMAAQFREKLTRIAMSTLAPKPPCGSPLLELFQQVTSEASR